MPKTQQTVVGIDAGATLWKLVLLGEPLEKKVVPAGSVDLACRQLKKWQPTQIRITGGGAATLGKALPWTGSREVPEFNAWGRGAYALSVQAKRKLPDRFLLVSLGTGISILHVDGGVVRRVGGSTLGGGTLVGLGRLLGCANSHREIVALAEVGDRRNVDLLVGDIYREGTPPLSPDLPASSFAKEGPHQPADLARALVELIGENIGRLCAAKAESNRVSTVFFGGSTLDGSTVLHKALTRTVATTGCEADFLPDGAFCGAVGAALCVQSITKP